MRPASRVGEHVWPKWFLKVMDSNGAPPNSWLRNGKPIVNTTGQPIHLPKRTRVFLPVCTVCNNELARRFENPAIQAVTQLAKNHWGGFRTASEWQAVGMWWAKIGLMLGHETARYDHRELNKNAVRFDDVPPDYTWMVDNSRAPSDLSVFVHHARMEPGETEAILGVPQRVDMADGTVRHSHVFQIVTPDISVSVVSHPGMTIRHPLVERGEAWELLRGSPAGGDLSSLRQYGHRTVVYRQGVVTNQGFQIDVSETSRLMTLFAHEIEQVPEAYPGIATTSADRGSQLSLSGVSLKKCSRRIGTRE